VVTTVSAPAKAHQDTKRAQKKRLTFASGDDVMNSKLLKDESSPVSPIQAVMQSSETMSALQSWFFENEDEKSMARLKKNEIVDMCTERGIESDGLSKPDMIEALFRWVISLIISLLTFRGNTRYHLLQTNYYKVYLI
jgi:hypothetical protein